MLFVKERSRELPVVVSGERAGRLEEACRVSAKEHS
jgi:hypothetical protein